MHTKFIEELAVKTRIQFGKRCLEHRFLPLNLPPIETLTDEQVLEILKRLSEIDSAITRIKEIATSNLHPLQAREHPERYLQLFFLS